jgi:hypothetical protein
VASRIFTLEEALQLLPVVRELLSAIQTAYVEVGVREDHLDDVLLQRGGNGHQANREEDARTSVEAATHVLQGLLEELDDLGVELKGIEEGLVDFRSMRDGRVVYLCFRNGEETIAYWHELDGGFGGRQPL